MNPVILLVIGFAVVLGGILWLKLMGVVGLAATMVMAKLFPLI